MYKKAPNRCREEEEFYPLQLRYALNENPANLEGEVCLRDRLCNGDGHSGMDGTGVSCG